MPYALHLVLDPRVDLSDLLPICPPSVDLREQQQQPPEVPERPAGGGVVGSGPPGGRVPAETACGGDLVARGGSARGESKNVLCSVHFANFGMFVGVVLRVRLCFG